MSSFVFLFYRFVAIPLAWILVQFAALFDRGKLQLLVKAKNKMDFRLKKPLAEIRALRPFWIHASSGEIEYARPVLRELKKNFPEVPLLVTYSSPSALRILEKLSEVDAWGPLPWEFSGSIRKFLKTYQPRALLVARTDLWPLVAEEAARASIPQMMFASTFASGSSRLRGLTRFLTARSLKKLSAIQVVSEEDMENLRSLDSTLRVQIGGDTRFDQVLYRLEKPQALPLSLKPDPSVKVFVAGSTWPEDEDVLLPAWSQTPGWKWILAPHEMNERRIEALGKRLQELGLTSQRFSAGGSWNSSVLIIDQIGLLAELYTWGHLAFVGGSFRKQVHSVMEPLAAGLRVLVGPHHLNNREALAFQKEMALGQPAVLVVQNSSQIQEILKNSLGDSGDSVKKEIQELVSAKRGATKKVIDWTKNL